MPSITGLKRNPADDHTVGSETTDASQTVQDENEELQEVMSDNLELMLEIIMKIREDEDFARSVYADCPRLQNLLDQHPDLRPIFEDPKIVRINFENVYRKAGGRLPEDKISVFTVVSDTVKKVATTVTDHPAFKAFQFLVFLKKCYAFVMGFGANALRTMMTSMFANGDEYRAGSGTENNITNSVEDQMEQVGAGTSEDLHKDTLYKAADHMEDPDVRQQMNSLVESDPDKLSEAIESDPELRSLRESNPLCAELMSDPSTMRILVDPDNLRALGDCPDLIEMDFADPSWKPETIDVVPFDDTTNVVAPEAGSGGAILEEIEQSEAANKKQEEGQDHVEGEDGQSGGGGSGYGAMAGLGLGVVGLTTGGMLAMPGSDILGGGGGDLCADLVAEQVDAAAEKGNAKEGAESPE